MTTSNSQPVRYFASQALIGDSFVRDVTIEVDARGWISSVHSGHKSDATPLRGVAIPGMPDLHSHAFQRAMAGLAETAGPAGDSFWTWRDTMYRFLGRLGPEEVEAIAAQLYVELLKQGYTAIAEFHYVHNSPDGSPYANRAELAERIVAASETTGIGLTLLPVLYQTSQFGGAPPTTGQRRFINSTDTFLSLISSVLDRHRKNPQFRMGLAPHSLRAVPPDALREAVAGVRAMEPVAPVHVHIAEQDKEVADCIAWSGKRPIEWLLENAKIDERWCLVHCTQSTPEELKGIAKTGAVAGLCPTTEANLGDGIFPLLDFLPANGIFGIGSDSNVCTSPAEELRLLEYAQRLVTKHRNVAYREPGTPTGARLYRQALVGGAQACSRPIGSIEPGKRADIVVLDHDSPVIYGRNGDAILDSWIFSANGNPVRDVMVGGKWVVQDGRHYREDSVASAYRTAISHLSNQ